MLPGGGMMGGNSKIVPVISNTTFDDIAGYEETKLELTEVVDILCNRNGENNTYDEIGARVPKGVIMEGPPGTGKTLMARAVAGEAGASFFSASGSEFVQMFVGLGASRVRDLFRLARENAPAIVFIDEIDAIGRQRESNGGVRGGNDEREQTLNQILTEIDGFNSKDGPNVIVIAATNRIDILDPALIRAGRFDRKVRVPLPDKNSRRKILELELTKKNIDTSLDLDLLSGITAGSSGSDINVLINEAALLGARKGLTSIDMKLIQSAFEKMQIGIPVAVDSRSDETKRLIAVHESGHAIVGQYLHTHPNVTKITIAATTNGAGGYTVFGSPDDSPIPSRKTIVERLATMLGGRAAELFIYGEDDTTIGASMDLEQATSLARQSVGNYGLGGFLETQSMQTINFESDWKREQVDRTVRDLINEAFQLANQTISNNQDILDRLVEDLIQQTTIDSFAL
jgi:cell division protease FtsH